MTQRSKMKASIPGLRLRPTIDGPRLIHNHDWPCMCYLGRKRPRPPMFLELIAKRSPPDDKRGAVGALSFSTFTSRNYSSEIMLVVRTVLKDARQRPDNEGELVEDLAVRSLTQAVGTRGPDIFGPHTGHRSIDRPDGRRFHPANGANGDAPVSGGRRYVATPAISVVGSLGIGYLLFRYFPEARGSGVPQTKAALYAHDGRITLRTCWESSFVRPQPWPVESLSGAKGLRSRLVRVSLPCLDWRCACVLKR
jgi:hypothetical protein